MDIIERTEGEYFITTDAKKMDIAAIHDFLCYHSGWSNGISVELVRRSVAHSLNFGLFHHGRQVGYARVISDYATIAYLGDVYVLEGYRGKKLSSLIMDVVMQHPALQGLRRWILLTSTAPWLYQKYGFAPLPRPEVYMELYNPQVYMEC